MTIIRGDARQLDLSQFNPPYGVIVADCPWLYYKAPGVKVTPHDIYEGMTQEELCNMPIPQLRKRDSVIYMWGTWPKLMECIEVLTAWEYEYVTGFPWIKMTDKYTIRNTGGHWMLGVSEYVLIGKTGSAHPPKPADRYLGIISPSLKHSKKPDSVHEIAETLPGPYLELFARRDRQGWDCFGNQFEEDEEKINNRMF